MILYLIIVEDWNGYQYTYSRTLAFCSQERRDHMYDLIMDSDDVEGGMTIIQKAMCELDVKKEVSE